MNQEEFDRRLQVLNKTKTHYENTLVSLKELEKTTKFINEELTTAFRIKQVRSILNLCNKELSDFKKENAQYTQQELFPPALLLPKL